MGSLGPSTYTSALMIFNTALERLRQLSVSKVGGTSSGDFFRFTQVDQKQGGVNDAVLSTIESARRTLSTDFGAADFKFYQSSATEQFIVLHGRSAESVAHFDFRTVATRVSELVNELLADWEQYDVSMGDILFRVDDKVIEILLQDIAPISDVAIVKGFTFGGSVGEGARASVVGNLVLDLLRHTQAPESLLPVKWSDAGSVVIMRPKTLEYLRTLASPSSPEPVEKKSVWQRPSGAS